MKTNRIPQVLTVLLMTACMVVPLALTSCGNGGSSNEVGPAGSVTIKIDITAAVEAKDATAVALAGQKGGNTYSYKVGIDEKDNVLTALQNSPSVVAIGSGGWGKYVDAIDGLASGVVSDVAGWTFTINGEFAMVGPEEIPVKDGDVIVFTYVTSWE
ncbi:MAG: DUF4430 domain-containing protein [Coriobacteriales bacterium]|jgi:hypothetical protein|nr:DUF4430 domain-containing protein [Coriobacteriales bacterium]